MPVAALSRTPSLALRSTQAVLAPPVKVVRMVNGLTKSVTVQPPAAPKDAASSAQGTAAALTFNMGFVGYDHKATFAAAELNPADQDMSTVTIKAHLIKGFRYTAASSYLYAYQSKGSAPAASLSLKGPSDTKATALSLKSGTFTAKESGEYTFTWSVAKGGKFTGAFDATIQGTEPPLPKTTGNTSLDAMLQRDVAWWHAQGATPSVGTTQVMPGVWALSPESSRQQLSYSFTTASQAPTAILKNDFPSIGKDKQFAEMDTNQKAAARAALAYISSVTKLSFTEATDGSGNIQLGTYDMSARAGGAYGLGGISNLPASYPLTDKVYTFLNAQPGGYVGDSTAGTVGWSEIWHELGHALGLKHPGNYDASGSAATGPFLPSATDNQQYSLMSYKSNAYTEGVNNLSYMLYDVAALQYLYGVNTAGSTAAGDVAGAGGQFSFSDSKPGLSTLYSATGRDTIDLAGLSKGSTVNLNAGTFSSINMLSADSKAVRQYSGNKNVALAYGSKINKVSLGTAVAADTVVLNGAFKQGAFNDINNLQSCDRIALSKSLFGSLTAKNIDLGTSGTARNKDSRIVVNQSTGDIYYDADGSGSGYAAVKIAAYRAVAGAAVSSNTFAFVA